MLFCIQHTLENMANKVNSSCFPSWPEAENSLECFCFFFILKLAAELQATQTEKLNKMVISPVSSRYAVRLKICWKKNDPVYAVCYSCIDTINRLRFVQKLSSLSSINTFLLPLLIQTQLNINVASRYKLNAACDWLPAEAVQCPSLIDMYSFNHHVCVCTQGTTQCQILF